jgi:hypothetical protein
VRAASIGDNSGGWEGLTVKGRRRWRSDGNRRGGGVSGGGSWQGRHVGGGEGGSSSSGVVERRTRSRTSAFQAPRWRRAARGKRRGPCGRGHVANGEGGEGGVGCGRRRCHATGGRG